LLDDDEEFDMSEEFLLVAMEEENYDSDREVKLYHSTCWRKVGCPDFKDARWSRYADDQGFFFGENDIG